MKNKLGYTLIELVVVAGIMGIIGIVSVGLFMSTILGGGKSSALNDVRSNGDYAITQMERMIRGARKIVSACSLGMNTITIKNSDGDNTVFSVITDQGNTLIASNSGYLTSSDVQVVGPIVFDCSQSSSKAPELVTIHFTLQKGDDTSSKRDFAQEDFSTTVQVRSTSPFQTFDPQFPCPA